MTPLLLVSVAFAATPDVAERILGAAVAGQSYQTVSSLADRVGARLAGTPAAERAVEWAASAMRAAGLKNVRKEPVTVPRWVRGEEAAELVTPGPQPLRVAALGGTVATPAAGITAEVIEVASFDELKTLGDKARGKIVLYNKAMQRTRGFEGYGAVVGMRGRGAVEAAQHGAVAALIRSTGTGYHRLAHTGGTRYDDKVPKIPFASVSAEDAELIHRLIAAGETVKVRLKLGAKLVGEVASSNVVGELVGAEKPNEIVVIGAHLDSWDVGTGALDDGAGVAIVLETARIFNALGLQPRRTVRVVLFMNEELGLSGARAYAETHKDELKSHVAAMEADAGAGRPYGYAVAGARSLDKVLALAPKWLHAELRASEEAGADLIPLQAAQIPVLSVMQDMSQYFEWHHTAGDTVDKIDPTDLGLATAAFASMAWAVTDSPTVLPPSPPPPRW